MPLCNAKKTIVGRPVTAFLGSFALMGSLVMLTSCADSWPDSLDPSDWYAAGVGEEVAPRSEEPVPGENEDYPNLAEVPETPTNVSSAEEIEQVAQSLSADLANAQYTTDLQRADDETTPQAMPLAQPEVVDVVTETTYIEPGGEIEIAEAQAVVLPEVEEVVEAEAPAAEVAEVVAVEAAPAMETEAVAMAEMAQPEPEPMTAGGIAVGESRVETETIRGEDGELVGTVTRVVVAEQMIVGADGEPVAVAAPEPAEIVVVEQPAMETETVAVAEPAMESETVAVETPAMETVAVAEVVAEPEMVAEVETAPAATVAAPEPEAASGQSLVAQSERDTSEAVAVVLPEQVVVVPEYAADLAAGQVEPVDESAAAVPSQTAAASVASSTGTMGAASVAASETRIEQQTVVDNNSGELIGSVTRTVEVTEVVQTAPVSGASAEAAAAPETEMTFTEVAETLAPSAEPAQVEAVTTVQPAVTAVPEQAQVVTVPAETLDFAALLSASGPDAGTAEQPIVIASAEPVAQTQAVFTTQPSAPVSEVLAAIIRFGDGSSSLGAVERDIVRQLAMLHAERGGQIRLVGHASRAAGGMETAQQQLVNFNISLDRATAVAEELIRQGVPRNDVVVEAAGDNQAGSDAAQDRRVDVLFGA